MEEIVSIYTVLVGVILFLDPEWSGSTQMNDPNGRENQKERKKEKRREKYSSNQDHQVLCAHCSIFQRPF